MSRPGRAERPIKTSDYEVRDTHAQRTSNQDGLPAESVDVENSRNGRAEEEHTPDAAGEQRRGVSCEAEVFEDERRIIQDRIDARPCDSVSTDSEEIPTI